MLVENTKNWAWRKKGGSGDPLMDGKCRFAGFIEPSAPLLGVGDRALVGAAVAAAAQVAGTLSGAAVVMVVVGGGHNVFGRGNFV